MLSSETLNTTYQTETCEDKDKVPGEAPPATQQAAHCSAVLDLCQVQHCAYLVEVEFAKGCLMEPNIPPVHCSSGKGFSRVRCGDPDVHLLCKREHFTLPLDLHVSD